MLAVGGTAGRKIMNRRFASAALALTLAPAGALAHHPMGGTTPASLADGLLSGLGHPVIGFDHLAMIVAAGVAAAFLPRGFAVVAAFAAATLAGVGLHLGAVTVPGAEILVALSVVAVGALIAGGARLSAGAFAALFGFCGLLHGYAYGEAIVGAEAAPLGAYLLGLAAVQLALAEGVRRLARMAGEAPALRTAGGAVFGAGLVLAGTLVSPF